MGKYLQDVLFYGPAFSSTSRKVSDEAKRNYHERYYETLKSLPLLQTLYSYYLPKRYETHYRIWRFVIRLEEQSNKRLEEIGHVSYYILPFDNEALKTRSKSNRKAHLLELCQTGIREICSFYRCTHAPFEEVCNRIKEKGILLSEELGKPVHSPNRKFTAQLHAYQSEDSHEISVVIATSSGEHLQKIKISELPHGDFDKITWIDNSNLKVSYFDRTSIRGKKKLSRNYFELSIDLLRNKEFFSSALRYLPKLNL